jgi:hypothetical protein
VEVLTRGIVYVGCIRKNKILVPNPEDHIGERLFRFFPELFAFKIYRKDSFIFLISIYLNDYSSELYFEEIVTQTQQVQDVT